MDNLKKWIVWALSALSSFFGALAIPLCLLIGSNIIDYFTGIVASPKRGVKIDSTKGTNGIQKKVCMYALVIIGAMVDVLLDYSSGFIGISLNLKFLVSSVVTIWLVINEWISIIENINDIGVDLPPFLLPLIKNIKTQVEYTAEEMEKIENDK